MTLVEFAEKISPIPLTEWQKQYLATYEQVKNGKEQTVAVRTPSRSCRRMLMQIIQEFEREIEQNRH